jgi:hypothetical protein
MVFLLFVWVTLAFVVACADSVAEDSPRPLVQRVARAALWPATVTVWFTHRTMPKLARLGAIVWLLLTAGWLLSLEADRLPTTAGFLLVAEATMAFVVWCVDAMSADLQRRPLRRVLRGLFWFEALVGYLRDRDSVRLIQASVTVWVLLTSGWLLSLMVDRIGQPLGWLGT